ncbi:glutamate ligase domain-containing protein [Streptomyces sp. x-19]|uniref:glutamate ligase domain-containing protein n=1 Tax=Streptomyces sp. x-19 TaxID=2789280 RepID=UPI003980D5DE
MTEADGPAATDVTDTAVKLEGGRTIAVLGEMLELGEEAVEAHRSVGRMAGEFGIDIVIGVGGDMVKQLVLYAGAAGVPEIAMVADNETAAAFLEKILRPGDKVLVKASRSGMLWQVAQRLTGQPVTGF